MNKVIVMYEESRGMIGIAASYQDAIRFLLDNEWLVDYTEIWQDEKWCFVDRAFGKDWKNHILSELTLKEFNDIFDGVFHLNERKVFEKKLLTNPQTYAIILM